VASRLNHTSTNPVTPKPCVTAVTTYLGSARKQVVRHASWTAVTKMAVTNGSANGGKNSGTLAAASVILMVACAFMALFR